MSIETHELIPRFVRCCPHLRSALVGSVDSWLRDDGEISYFQVVSILARHVVDRFDAGDYTCADDLFALVETLLDEGSEDVKDIVATGFIEAMLFQTRLPPELWVSLLGPRAKDYIRALNRFHGTTTPGVDEPDAI